MTRIDELDLKRFEFDLDLTFAVFFMNSDGGIYGRYGGRDSRSAENRQSLAGLRHAMAAALRWHGAGDGPVPVLRGRSDAPAFPFVRQFPKARRRGGCFHCHQIKEVMIDHLRAEGKWEREMAWRYPLPEQVGFALDVDLGDRVASVIEGSPADVAGLREGDVVEMLGGAVVESLADAQYGLDHAPWEGETEVVWRRAAEGKLRRAAIELEAGWKRSNLLWRASMVNWVRVLDLDGERLIEAEREAMGLEVGAMAFKVDGFIPPSLHAAGVRAGGVIIGMGGEKPGDLDSEGIDAFVGSRFQVGDRMAILVIRDKERKAFTARF